MSELMELEPRTVDTELEEPEVEFAETRDVPTQDRGRCEITVWYTTIHNC